MKTGPSPWRPAALLAAALSLAALGLIGPARGAGGAPSPSPAGAAVARPPATPAAVPAAPTWRAEAEAWAVALELPALLPPGAPALASVRLTARAGHHVNLEYPASFRPDASATVAFAGARVPLTPGERAPCAGRPAETCELTLPLPFTPGTAPPRLAGTVHFSVCTADRCLIERVALEAARP